MICIHYTIVVRECTSLYVRRSASLCVTVSLVDNSLSFIAVLLTDLFTCSFFINLLYRPGTFSKLLSTVDASVAKTKLENQIIIVLILHVKPNNCTIFLMNISRLDGTCIYRIRYGNLFVFELPRYSKLETHD